MTSELYDAKLMCAAAQEAMPDNKEIWEQRLNEC